MIDTIQTILIIVTAAYLLYMKREQNMGTALILKLNSENMLMRRLYEKDHPDFDPKKWNQYLHRNVT